MKMKVNKRLLILSGLKFSVSLRSVGRPVAEREGERERAREREGQVERNMIYPDLCSTLRTMKGGTRERWQ